MSFTPTPFIENINNSNWIEVSQESDFGEEVTPGEIELTANTIYFVRGEITMNSNLICNVEGVEIVGTDRNSDHLIWNGTGVLLTITDVNFGIRELKFSSNNVNTSILDATNIAATGYNFERLKVLTIFNCQFRGTYDVIDVKGFDLVDINNCLFFYIKATNFGLRFEDTSKIQLSSCELIRWFDETNIANSLGAWSAGSYSIGDIVTDGPTFYKALTNNSVEPNTSIGVDWEATGYADVSMVELRNNNLASFGAVNINGSIIHPQQTQNGIDIGTASTTGFGTISGNAFINVGLSTGRVFLPEIPVQLLPDYSQTATKTYDIFANQGILNSNSGTVTTFKGNTAATALTQNTPKAVTTNVNAVQQASVRFTLDTGAARSIYSGIKQIYVSIHASFSYLKSGGMGADFIFYIAKGDSGDTVATPIAGSAFELPDLDDVLGAATIVYGTLLNPGDFIELWAENTQSDDDITVYDMTMLIRE